MDKEQEFEEYLFGVCERLGISPDHMLVSTRIGTQEFMVTVRAFIRLVLRTDRAKKPVWDTTEFVIRRKLRTEDAKATVLYFWEGVCMDILKTRWLAEIGGLE